MALSVQQRGGVFLVAVVCLLTIGICAPFSGHDLQRVVQIAIGVCAVLYGLSVTRLEPLVDRLTGWGLALVLVMLYRPAGLWPSTVRRREFKSASTDVLKEGE